MSSHAKEITRYKDSIPKLLFLTTGKLTQDFEGAESFVTQANLTLTADDKTLVFDFASEGRRSNLDGGESSWEDYNPPGRITSLSLLQTAEDLIWTVVNPPGRIIILLGGLQTCICVIRLKI